MPITVSPSGRPGGGRRWRLRSLTREDLLTFLVAAALCSASYCLAIWHNSRGAADSRVLGPGVAVAVAVAGDSSACRGNARVGTDEPLDFETHHSAESARLSVSASAAATRTTGARRVLRGAAVAWAPGRGARPAWADDIVLPVVPAPVRAGVDVGATR